MKLQIFAVFDKQSGAFGRPFFEPTKGMAIRTFSDATADGASPFAKHPHDYLLFHIGEYDDGPGLLTGKEPERLIGAFETEAARPK